MRRVWVRRVTRGGSAQQEAPVAHVDLFDADRPGFGYHRLGLRLARRLS